jgi:hypothetical protein
MYSVGSQGMVPAAPRRTQCLRNVLERIDSGEPEAGWLAV